VSRDRPALATFLDALDELEDFGTVNVRGNGQITMPKPVREALRLNEEGHWHLFGLPSLGVAIVVATPGNPKQAIENLMRSSLSGDRDGDSA
jgi:hypothetical protein